MALPTQVVQAGKRAEDIEAAIAKGEEPVKPDETVSDDLKPKSSDDKPSPEQTDDKGKTDDQPDTVESLQAANKALKHKFDVLQGKYNSEIKAIKDDVGILNRLKNDLREQREYNKQLLGAQNELSGTIAELRKQIEKGVDSAVDVLTSGNDIPADYTKILSQDELDHLEAEDLGGKTLEVFLKLARAAGGNNSDVEKKIADITKVVTETNQRVEETARDRKNDSLYAAIPDFAEINKNPKFIEWIKEPVSAFATQTRGQALQEAIDSGDLATLKVGIDAFRTEAGMVKPGKSNDPEPPPKRPNEPVEPDTDSAGTTDPLAAGKVYTMAEVRKFYLDGSKGRWAGREKEYAKIDRDIIKAQREGRIKQ